MMHSAEGETRELAVASPERMVANHQRVEKSAPRLESLISCHGSCTIPCHFKSSYIITPNADISRFCCLGCGSRFQRESLFKLHQNSAVCQQYTIDIVPTVDIKYCVIILVSERIHTC